jgi:putative lipoic acid-binding regulatory protein
MKVIGAAEDDFVGRVVLAAKQTLTRAADVLHRTRTTPNGEHVSVTLVMHVESPDEVLTVYEALQVVKGLKLLM